MSGRCGDKLRDFQWQFHLEKVGALRKADIVVGENFERLSLSVWPLNQWNCVLG